MLESHGSPVKSSASKVNILRKATEQNELEQRIKADERPEFMQSPTRMMQNRQSKRNHSIL
jgi:hypothetical protein